MRVDELLTTTINEAIVFSAGTELIAEIDWTELQQEGQNRINIYGKGLDGQWTPYSG